MLALLSRRYPTIVRIQRAIPDLSRLSFFGPIYALINLFIYILQNPKKPGIQSDLALMEVGAGYFARVKFATASEISIDFARELAIIAREATERAHGPHIDQSSVAGDQQLSRLPEKLLENVTVAGQHLVVEDQSFNDQTVVSSSAGHIWFPKTTSSRRY